MRVCPKCYSLFGDQQTCPTDGLPTVHYTEVLVGLHLGPYVVRSMVSEGGMGVVYVGEHPTLGRRVALKVLRPELSLRDDIVERFIQEARSVNTIGHANIVNIYDFGRTPFGTFYIVMEYLEGRTLRALLDAAGPQPIERVRFVIEAMGAALGAAHGKGFLHRDVKPENIMVGYRGNTEYVKLLDFGIAKLLSTGNTTATSSTMGTPQYMSPEQLDDAKLDHRSDIFALGCVAYELLTGQVPYPGGSQAAVRQAQLTRSPPPPSICRRDIHLAYSVDQAVLKSIELGPDARHQQMDDFLAAFEAGYADSLSEQASGKIHQHRQDSPRNWKVFAISGAFAVLLGTAVALAILFFGRGGGTQTARDAGIRRPDARPQKARAVTLAEAKAAARKRVEAALGSRDTQGLQSIFDDVGKVGPEVLRPQLVALLATRPRLAARALGQMPPTPETSVALLRRLPRAQSFTAHDLAAALARAPEQRKAAQAKLEALLKKKHTPAEPLRSYVLLDLAQLDRARYGKALRKAITPLRTPDWTLKARAALGDRKGLLAALKTELRTLPARLLLEMPKPPTVAKLRGLLPGQLTPPKHIAFAGLFAEHGDAAAANTLVDLPGLKGTDAEYRRLAALELGRLKRLGKLDQGQTLKARKALRVALQDPSSPGLVLAASIAILVF